MLGFRALGPSVVFGGQTFVSNYSVRPYDGDAAALGLLGNDVLKRFNLILDNRAGAVYLRANARVQEPFRNPEYYLVRIVASALVVLAAATVWFARRRARRTHAHQTRAT